MSYRSYPPPTPLLIGYDPVRDLPADHLARLVEQVVEASIVPPRRPPGAGQPPFDPRLPIKVLVYGYATGHRSSRQLERLCQESLPYLFLTRGDTPSYRTLCSVRVAQGERLEQVWLGLFAVAAELGLPRLGHVVLDSSKLRADAGPEAVVKQSEYAAVRAALQQILAEAATVDQAEDAEGRPGATQLGQAVPPEQMRAILRRVRKQLAREQRAGPEPPEPPVPAPAAGPPAGSAAVAGGARRASGRRAPAAGTPDAGAGGARPRRPGGRRGGGPQALLPD